MKSSSKFFSLLFLFVFTFSLIGLISAQPIDFGYNYLDQGDQVIEGFNYTINVNNSDYWQGYTPITFTNFLRGIFCELTGCTMSGNIDMGNNNITNILSTTYNITSCTEPESMPIGTVCWNPDEDTLNIVSANGQIIQVGREVGEQGINREGSKVMDGSVVYLSGASGDNPEFKLADGSNVSESSMVGILTTECENGDLCPVTVFGFVNNLDTTEWSLGDHLYINPNEPGNLTNVTPTLPNNPIWIATVVRVSSTVGRIFVSPQIDPADGFLINDIWATGNISTDGYFMGQPLDGSLGSGIIWIDDSTQYSELNVTCSGLNCSYNAFKMRLVNTSNYVTYCDIPAGSVLLTDNQHNVVYVDMNCDINTISAQNYLLTPTSPGGQADFMNAIAHDSETENVNGLGLENKRQIKLRRLLIRSSGRHLEVVNGGLNYQLNTFPSFNITSGEYVYLYDIVPTTKKNTETDGIEVTYHTGVGTWTHSDQTGLNLTYCDTGSGFVECSNQNLYRRVPIFVVGNNDSGTDETELHQLLPLENKTYTTLASCLDTETNPLTYTIPDYYQYGAVMLYSYCGRGSDSSWVSTNFLDMRTVRTGTATSTPEGVYVKVDGSEQLTNNWDAGDFNITASSFNSTIGFVNNDKVGISGNYTNGNCWTAYSGGIVYATNCTAL